MIFGQTDAPNTEIQSLVNEAVDESKGHVHRLLVTGGFLGFSIACWGAGRAFQSAYIVSGIAFRTGISVELIVAVRITTIVLAYLAFVVALAVCCVSLFSLPMWQSR